jgi:hypothetical protein
MRGFVRAPSPLALVSIVVLAGCGSGEVGPLKVEVSGTVTLDGAPLPEGEITFHPTGPGQTGGGPIKDGEFTVELTPAAMKVEITSWRETGQSETLESGESGVVRTQVVPAQFNEKTTLEATIPESDPPPLEFKLISKPAE